MRYLRHALMPMVAATAAVLAGCAGAPPVSHPQFDCIQVGMPCAEVEALLGVCATGGP
jgi:hypothetical protein